MSSASAKRFAAELTWAVKVDHAMEKRGPFGVAEVIVRELFAKDERICELKLALEQLIDVAEKHASCGNEGRHIDELRTCLIAARQINDRA